MRKRHFFFVRGSPNTLTPCLFRITLDSKTDSKTGRQQWTSVDDGGNRIGLWSGWKTLCHYSHFFAVSWTHKIAVRGPLHAQISQGKGRAFRQIGRIYVQKIEIGPISLQ